MLSCHYFALPFLERLPVSSPAYNGTVDLYKKDSMDEITVLKSFEGIIQNFNSVASRLQVQNE